MTRKNPETRKYYGRNMRKRSRKIASQSIFCRIHVIKGSGRSLLHFMSFQIQTPTWGSRLKKVQSRFGGPLLSFDYSFAKRLLLLKCFCYWMAEKVTSFYNFLIPPNQTIPSSKVGLVSSEFVLRPLCKLEASFAEQLLYVICYFSI